jgi:2-desacetyl-2-hydroxyethyl bacteriochlorophyllide A dehydrogenase
MMRASVLRARTFAVEDRAIPTPGPGQVLLKTRLCGICGSDLHLAKHLDEIVADAEAMGAPKQDMSQGLILGHEFVGEVVSFGSETQQTLAVGDRVTSVPFLLEGSVPKPIGASVEGGGAYAEYMLASEVLLLKIPDALSDAAAALVEPFAIGVHAVNKAGIAPGEAAAVVLGCGPIGLAVAAVLKMHGANIVVASDFSPKRRELAAAMGATVALDPREADPFAAVAEAAPGIPLVIYDCTGVHGVLGRTITQAPQGARIVVAGIAHGEETINPMLCIAKELMLQFVVYYTPEEFAETLAYVVDGKLNWKPLVTGTIGLDAVADAFKVLEDPERHAKIMIDPWSNAAL